MTPAEMRARVEEMAQRAREEMAGASEVDYLDALLARQHAILTGVANALRGDPGPLASHSHHDLAERAAAAVALLEVAQTSLAAATSGRRVTVVDEIERLQRELASAQQENRERREQTARTNNEVAELLPDDPAVWGPGDVAYALVQARDALDAACEAEDRATADEPLLDGTDGAHPAWWRGHDRAAEMLTAQRDAAVARAEAAEREAARLRGFLPPVAVVVCPACGVDITADLDDDAEYITHRHSRRAPKTVGLGEIVWCDGGVARAVAR